MTHPTEPFLQLLLRKVEHLEQQIYDQGTLGFTQGRRFIYIQNTKRSLWSYIDTDEPVNAIALTGYIVDLYRKEDEVPKLHVAMRTREEEYVLCSGFETHFSRDVMAAIAQLTPDQLRRPLKIIPCLKDVKKAGQEGDKSIKKPVYANVLLDDKTLYTSALKQRLSAEDLFMQAQAVLQGKAKAATIAAPVPASAQRSAQPPQDSAPARTDSPTLGGSGAPSDPWGNRPQPTAAVHDVQAPAAKTTPINWKGFCQQYGILPGALKALAQELGLPMGKLTASQSARLYQQAYSRFVRGTAVS
ncbi:hypothetical protein [Lyngbya confervoides]|uniref:Uncharacterized protein n=1 Tax=Lyngbya confervoides BDU141951 TaxID=1574623 RepID=A0ABD4SZX2_9CYAN|nr:hypothetical protein [Lyngbya confervoides]MCM1981685.1 hypothetical protein [Lyngbya confervoides BDU141951]